MASAEKVSGNISSELDQLKNQFEEVSSHEINIYKKEILREIKEEVVSRYSGTAGKIKVALDYDKQFQTALNIINDPAVYNKLLNDH